MEYDDEQEEYYHYLNSLWDEKENERANNTSGTFNRTKRAESSEGVLTNQNQDCMIHL